MLVKIITIAGGFIRGCGERRGKEEQNGSVEGQFLSVDEGFY